MAGNRLFPLTFALLAVLLGLYLASPVQWSVQVENIKPAIGSNGTHAWASTVLLVSLDGLKPDYLTSGHLPNLYDLSNGHWPESLQYPVAVLGAESMKPVSPSLTFPNHWSIQTGLQPSSHGIIANDFHIPSDDSIPGQSFYYTDPLRSWDSKWWQGVSIWEQMEKIQIKTANLMWPGPPVTASNISSTYFQKYEKGWTLDDRLDQVMSWLDKEYADRPRFLCAYAPDVDTKTHSLGPNVTNEDISATLQAVDRFILGMLKQVESRNASSFVNIIVVSDHGMTETSNDRLLYLEDLLGESLYSQMQYWDGWPNVGLRFVDGTAQEEVAQRLQKAARVGSGQFQVADRKELMKMWKWDLTDTVRERVAEWWILPEVGWSVTTREEMQQLQHDYRPKGNHGYHADNADMNAFFLALGPAIKSTPMSKLKPFSNLEIHNLVMDMLHIQGADRVPTHGTPGFWDNYITFAPS